MFPRLTHNQRVDTWLTDAVLSSQRGFGNAARSVALSNDRHLIGSQFREMTAFAARGSFRMGVLTISIAISDLFRFLWFVALSFRMGVVAIAQTLCHAALLHGISDIVGWRAKKQMIGPNACGCVATVTDEHTIGNRAVHDVVGKTMRTPIFSSYAKRAVSILQPWALPQPACVCSDDFRPEAGNIVRGILRVHIDLQSMCRATSVTALRGFRVVRNSIPQTMLFRNRKQYIGVVYL